MGAYFALKPVYTCHHWWCTSYQPTCRLLKWVPITSLPFSLRDAASMSYPNRILVPLTFDLWPNRRKTSLPFHSRIMLFFPSFFSAGPNHGHPVLNVGLVHTDSSGFLGSCVIVVDPKYLQFHLMYFNLKLFQDFGSFCILLNLC